MTTISLYDYKALVTAKSQLNAEIATRTTRVAAGRSLDKEHEMRLIRTLREEVTQIDAKLSGQEKEAKHDHKPRPVAPWDITPMMGNLA